MATAEMEPETDAPAPETRRTGTRYPELFAALAAEFDRDELYTRNQGGRQLTYITARVAQNRFDEVCGPENWRPEYQETATGGVRCRIWVRLPDGEWLCKEDGGAAAGMPELDNNEKSAYSDSFKRAAVAWGVARYLYRNGVADFGQGDHPEPPSQARPPVVPERPRQAPATQREQPRRAGDFKADGDPPRTGKALYAFAKAEQERTGVDALKWLGRWGKQAQVGDRLTEWPAPAVQDGYYAYVIAHEGGEAE